MFNKALTLASFYLEAGRPIPLDIAAELMRQGVDVEALERKHKNG